MGCTQSTDAVVEAQKDRAVGKSLKSDMTQEYKIKKLLLLGPGESGKSTLFKQLTITSATGFSEEEKKQFSGIIQKNLVGYLAELCRFAENLSLVFPDDVQTFVKVLYEAEEAFLPCNKVQSFMEQAENLWNLPQIQKLWAGRSQLQVPDCLSYFMSRIEDVVKSSYVPSNEDILRVRNRTTGMVEKDFTIGLDTFRLIDVGGQRSERKKWIKYFYGIDGLLFTVAISEYDQTLWEDPTVNRIHEAISLFKEIVVNESFSKSAIVLFMNKEDLFREKLARVPLSVTFPDYSGASTFEETSKFLELKFTDDLPMGLQVFVHFTCATDSEKTKTLFNAVRDTVLKNSFSTIGLI
jgi:GTPase SAR1 family protein